MLVIGNGKLFTRDEKLPYIENGAVVLQCAFLILHGFQ